MVSYPETANWILASLSSGIVAIDDLGVVTLLNPGAQRILGCPPGDHSAAIGRHCREVLDSQPALVRLLLDSTLGREALSRAELVLEDVPGRAASTIGFTLTPVRAPSGEIRGAAILFRDLTPIERMDEQEKLRERLAALGQMAAGLAHEIRNPLATMEVIAGLLKRRLEGQDEERNWVEQLQGELRSLARTVNDCLEFVRPVALERGPVDAEDLMNESLAISLLRFPFEGAIERSFDEELPKLLGDEDQLRAVVTNLIVNAIEAMGSEDSSGDMCLRLGLTHGSSPLSNRSVRVGPDGRAAAPEEPGCELTITVSDTGPGVPSEFREKIFYPFFTTKQSGSGVGLAAAQKVVAGHGGSLELAPSSDRGCCFRIHLPTEAEKP